MLLAEELALVALKPESGRFQLGTGDNLNACLAGAGIVGAPTGGLRPKRLVLDRAAWSGVADRLQAAATGAGPIEAPTALVLSMTGPAHLLEVVAPDRRTRKHARDRIDHALDGSDREPVGKVVRRLIQEAAEIAGAAAAIGGAVAAGS